MSKSNRKKKTRFIRWERVEKNMNKETTQFQFQTNEFGKCVVVFQLANIVAVGCACKVN